MADSGVKSKLTVLLGGVRSGKSKMAERLAAERSQDSAGGVLYVATSQAYDDEMRLRIARHQQSRPASWHTLEAPLNVAEHVADYLRRAEPTPAMILLDCITVLAANAMLTLPLISATGGEPNPDTDAPDADAATSMVMDEITALLDLIRASDTQWIIVTNEVGMGVVPPYPLGRIYRDALGAANQRLAEAANEVLLLVAGLPWKLR